MNPPRAVLLALAGAATLGAVVAPTAGVAGLGAPREYTITITVVGAGTATVSSIDIRDNSSLRWVTAVGTVASVRASAGDFRGWRGVCTGTDEICTFTVTRDAVLNAYFAQDPPAESEPVVVPPVTPGGGTSGGSGSSPGASAGGTTSDDAPVTAPPGTPRLTSAKTRVGRRVTTTTGSLPAGVRTVTQHATLKASPGVSAIARCAVNRAARTFRCSAPLPKGIWIVTTRAMRGTTITAQVQSTVRVR